jgi:CBS domain containing-hemolysin-like protein
MLFVPPSMAATDLFGKMQATRIHLALVIDEYGGTDGLISIEDIVEQVVGEIEDEHDEDVPLVVVRQPDGSFLADARASIEEVSAALGTEFDVGLSDEVDTLGGYLFKKIGRIPVRGELVAGPGDFEMEVADADPRRVKKVKITRRKEKPAPDAPGVPAASETVASSSGTPAAPEAPGGKPGETPSDPGP